MTATQSGRTKTEIEIAYEEFEYLASRYAREVFNHHRMGYEYEDVLQEFKIKIYTTIIAWGNAYAEWMAGKSIKPVPLKFYLQRSLKNKVNDFIKELSTSSDNAVFMMSIESTDFDYGKCDSFDSNQIDWEKKKVVLNGIDLLEGLGEDEKRVYCLYLRGMSMKKIKGFFPKYPAKKVIRMQNKRNQKFANELVFNRETYMSFTLDND